MNCREILKIYQLFVDEEMDGEDLRKSFEQHIKNCPDCAFRVKFEVQFKSCIRQNVRSRSAPSELEEQIKREIF